MCKCIGRGEKGISRRIMNSGRTKREIDVVGMLIPHVRDLLISGDDAFIAYSSGRLGIEYGAKVCEGGEAIYLGVEIKKLPSGLTGDGNISDGLKLLRARH